KVGTEHIRLGEFHVNTPIERRPFPLYAEAPRATEEIQMVPAKRRAELLLRAVSKTGREPTRLSFHNGHTYRNLRSRLRSVLLRLHVGELEQIEGVEPSLCVAHVFARKQVARLEGELTTNDVLADALGARNVDRPKVRKYSGHCRIDHVDLTRASWLLRDSHVCVRIAVVP